MVVNIGYKQFSKFDVWKDSENIYARFVKYAKRSKANHLKAYNITEKAQQWSLFLDSIGESTLNIFEQLGDTGTDLDGDINALLKKVQRIAKLPVQYTHQTRQRRNLGFIHL